MERYVAQCRYGPYEMFVEVEAESIGKAIIEVHGELMKINPHVVFECYAVKVQDVRDIVLEDLILN